MSTLQAKLFPNEPCAVDYYHCALQSLLPSAGQMLDLGCGDNGELARYRTPERIVWGTDFQRHPQMQHGDWFRLMELSGTIPFASQSFDVIVSRWVLEHVADPNSFLAEVSRLLRPGGVFLNLSINGAHYVTWFNRVFRLFPHGVAQRVINRLYKRPHHDTFPTHYRLNSTKQLHRHAANHGFEVTSLRFIANPDYFSFFMPFRALATLMDWTLAKLRPDLGRIYFVVGMRK